MESDNVPPDHPEDRSEEEEHQAAADAASGAKAAPSASSGHSPTPNIIRCSSAQDSAKVAVNGVDNGDKLSINDFLIPLDENASLTHFLSQQGGSSLLVDSDLKCERNELGAIEVMTSGKGEGASDEDSIDLSCKETHLLNSPRARSPTTCRVRDEIRCCENCGCYGMLSEFFDAESCSPNCHQRLMMKVREKEKRERDLQLQKARREARKRERDEEQKQQCAVTEVTCGKDEVAFPGPLSDQPFSWPQYLSSTNSKGSCVKFFPQPAFPTSENLFKVGMKLEAIDPEHPAMICVVTVVQVLGYRVLLHFDGYPEVFDFWENANSPNIFPPGWCESQGQILHLPKNYPTNKKFVWSEYLKQTNTSAAPKEAFSLRSEGFELAGWQVHQKLEAVDRQNQNMVCVATVANILNGRILIHFDGWESDFDYWTSPSSPYIHPVGWCHKKGISINPPKDYNKPFSWSSYLEEKRSLPVPSWAFKRTKNEGCLFRKGMKLEVVDKRNPLLIRVATIADVVDHQLKIHLDGWPDKLDFWEEDTSLNIHPPLWCAKSGHPLTPPLTEDQVKSYLNKGGCPTAGCRGLGRVNGQRASSHTSSTDCPYASHNVDNENQFPDRLVETTEKRRRFNIECVDKEDSSKGHLGRGNRKRKRRKFFDEEVAKVGTDETSPKSMMAPKCPAPGIKCPTLPASNVKIQPSVVIDPVNEMKIRENVFQPSHHVHSNSSPDFPAIPAWKKNSAFLKSSVDNLCLGDVAKWSPMQVAHFITSLPTLIPRRNEFGQNETQQSMAMFNKIINEEVDGEAFLLLKQHDLVHYLGFKLGPAIKIFNSIRMIRESSEKNEKNLDF